ncbi:MAG: cryptochrome/photolyase family protein [Alphaproteobacteria bacterium]
MKDSNICDSIVWLRRDLRVHDHTSFASAINKGGRILPLFIFDEEILTRFKNKDDFRLSFISDSLMLINQELEPFFGSILILYGKASEVIPKVVLALKAKALFAAKDYEPETIERDNKVKKILEDNDIEFILEEDHALLPVESVKKSDNSPYRVYTAYKKMWKNTINQLDFSERIVNLEKIKFCNIEIAKNILEAAGLKIIKSKHSSDILKEIGYNYNVLPSYWKIDGAQKRLNFFANKKLASYKTDRNFMAKDGTSRLSAYIRFGLISIRECYRAVEGRPGADDWINELIWRDFYIMILYNFPFSSKTELVEQYRNKIEWLHNTDSLEAWKKGMTGFPLIDAGMRQLITTGWMHNRLRMITASFMCKQLLIDWRIGEEFFAQYLMDYDMAPNVGGWQWCSSTGTDAQPYFRIFNATNQAKEYDTDGEFIRKFVPELKNIPTKYIFEPKKYDRNIKYPAPIIDQKLARERAIQTFKRARKKDYAEY